MPATGQTYGLRSVAGECFPNTGDLFGTANKNDPRRLQHTFRRIVHSTNGELGDDDDGDGDRHRNFGNQFMFGFGTGTTKR